MRSKLQKFGLISFGIVAGILVSLNFSANALKESATALPVEELRSFADVFNIIKQNYVEPVDDKTMINNAIKGMLSNLDPHSVYLDPEAFKELQESIQGEFGGLGIEVDMDKNGYIRVVSPLEDSPAWRAGIKANDLIVKIDDTPVKGLAFSDAIRKMRGKPKTDLTLTIHREGDNSTLVVKLTRELVKTKSVKWKLMEPGYGYLRITRFQDDTALELVKALDRLYKEAGNKGEPLRGLLLDLRDNPGGALHAAIGVSAVFIPADTLVVSTDGRMDDAKRKYTASADDYRGDQRGDFLKQLPVNVRDASMIVLINGGSASASEIVAGALQDHKRALILGTQSFGKGSVQNVLPLGRDVGIKLTTARYYTPNGRSIQAKGITPDVLVQATPNGEPPDSIHEADLERHLINDKDQNDKKAIKRDVRKPASGREKIDDEDFPAPIEFASKDDYQVNQAMNLLKAWQLIQKK